MICLWNNFHQLAAKNDFTEPKEPLWFLKAPNAYWPANKPIQRPATYAGKIIYEGELGVVIGKKCCKGVTEADAASHIFGYTCVDDVTAVDSSTPSGHRGQATAASNNGRERRASTPSVPFGPAIAPTSIPRHCRSNPPERNRAAELSGRRHGSSRRHGWSSLFRKM